MRTIHHVFEVGAPPHEVYAALTSQDGLASWWTTKVDAGTGVGETVTFTFRDDFNPVMRIAELTAPTTVRWECVGGHDPWGENTFEFRLEPRGAGTLVRFWQYYARELSDDAYGTYNYNWGYYLESLRLRSETGAGKPFQA